MDVARNRRSPPPSLDELTRSVRTDAEAEDAAAAAAVAEEQESPTSRALRIAYIEEEEEEEEDVLMPMPDYADYHHTTPPPLGALSPVRSQSGDGQQQPGVYRHPLLRNHTWSSSLGGGQLVATMDEGNKAAASRRKLLAF